MVSSAEAEDQMIFRGGHNGLQADSRQTHAPRRLGGLCWDIHICLHFFRQILLLVEDADSVAVWWLRHDADEQYRSN